MSAQPRDTDYMTVEEYLTFEDESDIRHEYIDGEIYAMTGASVRHNIIISQLIITLGNQLRDKDCLLMANDTRIKVDASISYRYPDLVIICGKPKFVDGRNDTISNPVILIEVLSPSTELIDRNPKLDEYTQIPDLEEYVLVSQDTYKVERFLRQDSGDWLYTKVGDLDGVLSLPSIDCTLALADVYNKLDLLDTTEDEE